MGGHAVYLDLVTTYNLFCDGSEMSKGREGSKGQEERYKLSTDLTSLHPETGPPY